MVYKIEGRYSPKPPCPPVPGGQADDFPAVIVGCDNKDSKGGNQMLALTLQLLRHPTYPASEKHEFRDWIMGNPEWFPEKRKALLSVAGKSFDAIHADTSLVLGLRLTVQGYTEPDSYTYTDKRTGQQVTRERERLRVNSYHPEGWRHEGSQEPQWEKPEPDGSPEEPTPPTVDDDGLIPF